MMKALTAIGFRKASRYLVWPLIELAFGLALYSPLRALLLRLLGAQVGPGTVLHRLKFLNFYRGSFKNLQMGEDCFIGNDVRIDLAARTELGNQVTVAERVLLLTHMNVGYVSHPLQARFPAQAKGLTIGSGSFIGAGAIILDGSRIGERVFVAAGAVVSGDVESDRMVGGAPARVLKTYSPVADD